MAENQQVIEIDVDVLQPNPLQPRGLISPDSLVELVDSVRGHGILEPLVVAKTPAGYQIIAGERRWRAGKIAGLKTVPCIIKETTPQGMLEMAIVENVQRVDLNAIERGQAYNRLMDDFGLSNMEIAQRVGKSPSFISNSIRLLTLPDAIKDGLISNLITEGHARALAAIGDARLMVEAYKVVLRESGSVRRAEDLARRMKNVVGKGERMESELIVAQEMDDMRDALTEKLNATGCRSKVKLSRSRIETRITLVLKGTLEETEKALQKIYSGIVG